MANLVSPGVSVTITDESFFVPAAAATVPLFFVASADEKKQPDGISNALGTFESNVIRTVTSLQQSTQLYGVPRFLESSTSEPHHGDARNEYGLLALNQFLGVGNRAFVVRANVNLNDDLTDTRTSWMAKMVSAASVLEGLVESYISEYNATNGYIPADPLYKVTINSTELLSLINTATDNIWDLYSFKNLETDFENNQVSAPATAGRQEIDFTTSKVAGDATGLLNTAATYSATITVNGVVKNISVVGSSAQTFTTLLSELNTDLGVSATASIVGGNLRITSSTTGTSSTISIVDGAKETTTVTTVADTAGSLGGKHFLLSSPSVDYYVWYNVASRAEVTPVTAVADVAGSLAGTYFTIDSPTPYYVWYTVNAVGTDPAPAGKTAIGPINVATNATASAVALATQLAIEAHPDFTATVSTATVTITNVANGAVPNATAATSGFTIGAITQGISASVDPSVPSRVGIMVSVNGDAAAATVAQATQLVLEAHTDFTATVAGSVVTVANSATGTATNAADGTTTFTILTTIDSGVGGLFGNLAGYVGILTAVGGLATISPMSVYANGYSAAATGSYLGLAGIAAAWVAGNLGTTVGHTTEWSSQEAYDTLVDAADDFQYTVNFLNKTSLGANDAARRAAIVTALQASINSNTEIRSETYEYNLILCPGYHEVVDEMLALVTDIQDEALVIADTPMNMDPDAVVTWADSNARSHSSNVAYYYSHSYLSNLDGKNVLGAASGTALRTITYSDNVSELWFAPAGVNRGLVTGVSLTGHASGTLGGPTTFVETNLSLGQRDNLYKYFTNVNPISWIPGRGIIVLGQKTSAPAASAVDRINVSRLVKYIKRQLRKSAYSFLFEPNDQLTRDNLKAVVDGFLGDIIVKRGLYDFVSICDESNNTPDRIDRNEMYIDIAIKPVKAAEFIYIPIRIVATGTQI